MAKKRSIALRPAGPDFQCFLTCRRLRGGALHGSRASGCGTERDGSLAKVDRVAWLPGDCDVLAIMRTVTMPIRDDTTLVYGAR
jgi:hypothetical protein